MSYAWKIQEQPWIHAEQHESTCPRCGKLCTAVQNTNATAKPATLLHFLKKGKQQMESATKTVDIRLKAAHAVSP